MSYPEPRYHDDTGEVSATYRAADRAAEVVYPNGNTVHYLATGEATHGLFGLYRWEFSMEVSGPDPPPCHLRRRNVDRVRPLRERCAGHPR